MFHGQSSEHEIEMTDFSLYVHVHSIKNIVFANYDNMCNVYTLYLICDEAVTFCAALYQTDSTGSRL